ncbi:MAG: glycerophosphodiester phosphodiesterase [Candidatus Accumulibacter phosphatis]|uniref:glycerophosphodiester phosphodiesterase n=1 Tax=Candidatus Accumulibacter phosphatis TaxID=327160 RepID=UPI001A422795|nr:glycerophosphodiester phosphodiesterase [Candidatus Accumulibacter phosphatis]
MIRRRLGWPLPRVFAHRCGGALAPENTLAGLRIAARLGLRAVEFDVMLSADGSPWLIHDETLERTSNGAGRVCETGDGDLRVLDAGVRRHPAFAGEPLPTLAAAARLCQQLGLRANVEIKPAAGFETLTGDVVAREIRQLWAGVELPLVSSFSESALVAARAAAPELPLGCLYECPPADWPARVEALGALTLHCAVSSVDDDLLRVARAAAIPLLCYTVNDPLTATALFQRGVAAVFSDRIDCLGEAVLGLRPAG